MTNRCDGKTDCSDETDEAECKAFVRSIGYNRFAVPPPLDRQQQLDLDLEIIVQEIVEINEKDGFFRCKILQTRKWVDQKVTFQNLQNDSKLNIIHPEDRSLLWKPWTIFNNIEDRRKYTETDTEPLWKVIPNPIHSFANTNTNTNANTNTNTLVGDPQLQSQLRPCRQEFPAQHLPLRRGFQQDQLRERVHGGMALRLPHGVVPL